MKLNNKFVYVKNIPFNINKWLTNISSNPQVFNETITPYQKALDESGYSHTLTYNLPTKLPKQKETVRETSYGTIHLGVVT